MSTDTNNTLSVALSQMVIDPVPNIKANGSDDPVKLAQGDNLSITISLDPGIHSNEDADWWIVASTPMGWYYYTHSNGWHSATSLEEVQPAYQGPLSHLTSLAVLNQSSSSLATGPYTVYFGAELTPNGQIDYESLVFDYAEISIYTP